jgi:hypothetical protein
MNLIIRNVSEYQTPFCFPVLVDDRNQIQKQFSEHGLYAPCLWAIDPAARAVCKFSAGISDHILAIPIDQRYNYYDIENIARIIKTTIG